MKNPDKIYEVFKMIFECSLFLAMALLPWLILIFVVWVGHAWGCY